MDHLFLTKGESRNLSIWSPAGSRRTILGMYHNFCRKPIGCCVRADCSAAVVDSVCPESKERLIEWQNRVEKLRDHSHVWGYPPSQWREMIEGTGFTIENEVHTHNALQPFSWWALTDPAIRRSGFGRSALPCG